jgi:hypothetical protein
MMGILTVQVVMVLNLGEKIFDYLFTNNNCYLIITGKWNCANPTTHE